MPDIIEEVSEKIKNKNGKIFVLQIAPAVRVAIGEYFGFPPGTNVIGKLITACRNLGFDYIFDTNVGADFTIIEEANELTNRLKNKGTLPMFTTCCSSWYSFVEKNYPDLIQHLSTVKSPQAILASIVKTYFAEKNNIDNENIVHVVISPCVAKKQEARKEELWVMKEEGIPNIDYVLTTKEAVELFKKKNIGLQNLPDSSFDNPLGESTGAGAIFGTTGGVMEAAIRTANFFLTGKELENYELEGVRNIGARKEGKIKIGEYELNIAVINGLKEAKIMLDELRAKGSSPYHFIEVMACPMGCIGGPGQAASDQNVLLARREALFAYDKTHKVRASHQNPFIKEIYDNYLGEVGGEKARKILHIAK